MFENLDAKTIVGMAFAQAMAGTKGRVVLDQERVLALAEQERPITPGSGSHGWKDVGADTMYRLAVNHLVEETQPR
jgi:hypothetical protein